jgi:hypothetical protein
MGPIAKLKLMYQLNSALKGTEEGIKMKNATKIIAGIIAAITAVYQVPAVNQTVNQYLGTHVTLASIIGGIAALAALFHNPKATKAAILVLALVLMPGAVMAQTAAPSPTPSQFSISTFTVNASAISFSGGGSTSAASIEGADVAMTNRMAIGEDTITAPAAGVTYLLGDASYTIALGAALGKKITSKLAFNTSPWSVRAQVGAGVIRQSVNGSTAQHFAAEVGVGLNYKANGTVTINAVSVRWLNGTVVGGRPNQFLITPTSQNLASISSGLSLTF